MNKFVLSGFCVLFSGCVVNIVKYPIDDSFFNQYISKEYQHSKTACFSATKSALIERGYTIKYENFDDGKVVSDRRRFESNATRSTPIREVKNNSYVSRTHVESFIMKASDQFYFDVTGDSTKCAVSAFRWRAWNGEEEMKEIQQPGIDWSVAHVFTPLFDELSRILQGKPY